MSNHLADFYEQELASLREDGKLLAEKRPELAKILNMDASAAQDPFVRRLVESFALLTARLQMKLQDEFPQVATAMLETILPLWTRPIPSFGVVQFQDSQHLAAGSVLVEKNAILNLRSRSTIRFRPVYETEVRNLQVNACQYAQEIPELPPKVRQKQQKYGSTLRVEVSATGLALRDALLQEPSADASIAHGANLRFFLGQKTVQYEVQKLMLSPDSIESIAIYTEEGGVHWLTAQAVREVGFEQEDFVLPAPSTMPSGYRYIFEMFAFPERFLFFDLSLPAGFDGGTGKKFEICFFFKSSSRFLLQRSNTLGKSTLRLNCCPVVNLIQDTIPNFKLQTYCVDQPLSANRHAGDDCEIVSIEQVNVSATDDRSGGQYLPIHPFFDARQFFDPRSQQRFFFPQRRPRADGRGSEMTVSFVDATWNPYVASPVEEVDISIRYCNRFFLDNKNLGQSFGDLQVKEAGVIDRATLVSDEWTPLRLPANRNQSLWNLIAILNLNHLFLGAAHALPTLQQMLTTLNPVSEKSGGSLGENEHPWIKALVGVGVEDRIVGRINQSTWAGFASGTRVTVKLDLEKFEGYRPGSDFLLGRMLDQLLGMHTSVNSFVQVALATATAERPYMEFAKRCGNRRLI